MKVEAARQWRRRQRRRLFIVGGIGAAVLFLIIGAAILFSRSGSQPFEIARSDKPSALSRSVTVKLNIPPPDLLRPISPEEALVENSKREFSERPDSAAAAFTLNADSTSRERALECLTQAVYYEAAGDGADGERAVAQVVLNRMRHPAYPSSVCGVVYQGSDRPIGCQFTFTCDGSLARIPIPTLWKQAERIARQALAGKVFAPVGHSTHYHADYVLPYWANSLDKSVQIGRHIFYRLKGGLGADQRFPPALQRGGAIAAVAHDRGSGAGCSSKRGANAVGPDRRGSTSGIGRRSDHQRRAQAAARRRRSPGNVAGRRRSKRTNHVFQTKIEGDTGLP